MLNLNITRTELESRILKIIEDFNGCPLGKKSKRLSILNKSMKTLFYGDSVGMTEDGMKMNEHNLDSFFTSGTTEEVRYTYILSEDYNNTSNKYDNEIYTTTHDSREEAELYLYTNTIDSFIDDLYSMLTKDRIDNILSYLTDSELENLKESLFFDIYDAESDPDYASDLAIEIKNTENIDAIKALFTLLVDADNICGQHSITEKEVIVDVPSAKPISILSIVVMSSNPEMYDDDELRPTNYFSATDHKAEVLRMYNEIIKYDVGINISFVERLTNCKMIPASIRKQITAFESARFEQISELLVDELPIEVLLSQDFIRSIITPKKKVLVQYEVKVENTGE